MSKEGLNQERLKALLHYDPLTGILVWKNRPRSDFVLERDWKSWNTRFSGKLAGWLDDSGYIRLNIDKKQPRAHQVAWTYVHGDIDAHIDHINGQRNDNRLENLRVVTQAENAKNMRLSKKNKSGAPGVYWITRHQKWMARITHNREIIHLGFFELLEDAVSARKEAEKRYGFHENHGRISNGRETENSQTCELAGASA